MPLRANRTDTRRYLLREIKSLSPSLRLRILERDNNQCRICGIRVGLEVHHIEGEFADALPEVYNDLKNLITLCHHCHAGITSMELNYLVVYMFIIKPKLKAMVSNV